MLVNPYDIAGVSDAIYSGLEMNPTERRERMRRMRRQVMEYNIYLWAAKALGDLREVRFEGLETSRIPPSEDTATETPAKQTA